MTDERNEHETDSGVESYFADLGRMCASGGSTGERSSYRLRAYLLAAVGAALNPKVFCVGGLADQCAGYPDFGLYYAAKLATFRPTERAKAFH